MTLQLKSVGMGIPQYQGTAFACMSAVPVCSTVAFAAFLAACAASAV